MNGEQLRALQAPLKARYKEDAATAKVTVTATGRLDGEGVACHVDTDAGVVRAGLHPSTGGDGSEACSGDMLLQALVACAGVTCRAVATSMGIPLRGGTVTAEGTFDARGTLGVSKESPVGVEGIRLRFDLDTDAPPEKIETLLKLTERYCVIYQTLQHSPEMSFSFQVNGG